MALLGFIKAMGEEIRADVKEWMGTKYFEAALLGGAGLFVEEMTNNAVVSALGLSGWKEKLYRTIHRLTFSALYYFGGKSLGKPVAALTASIMPVAMAVVDGISWLIGMGPAEAGLSLSAKLWKKAATMSAMSAAPSVTYVAVETPAEQIPVTTTPSVQINVA